MFTEELRTACTALEVAARELDPGGLTGAQAIRAVEELGTISRLTDGMLAKAAKRVADTQAHVPHGDRSAAELCARLVGVGSWEAQRAIDNAARLEECPATDAAFREGRLSAQEAALISSVVVHDPSAEAELLEVAGGGLRPLRDACVQVRARVEDPEARAKRQHAARALRMWTATDGMLEGHFRLTPEMGGRVKAAIDDHTRRAFRAKPRGEREAHHAYAADALAELVSGEPGAGRSGGTYTTHILIDHEALVRGNALAGDRCEVPGVGSVNAAWVRELLGEAFVTAIIKQGRDITTVAHLGRHIPAELRTAMIVSGRECAVAGCTGRDYLELDHCEIDHARGGPTAGWNLAWLCSTHHRRKTSGWHLGPPDPETGQRTLHPPGRADAA